VRRRLLLTTDAVGGVWTYSLDLARSLSEAEDMVVLLAVLGPSPRTEQLTQAAAVPGLQIILTDLPLDWTAAEEREVRDAAAALATLAAEGEADLVQLHTPALALASFPAPVVSVVHSCVATWWEAVRGGPLPQDLAWRAALVREGLGRSDLVVAPTRAFAKALQSAYDLPGMPRVVHNGRRHGCAVEAAPIDAAVTAGRLWDEGKNLAAFDAAAGLSSAPFLAAGPLNGPGGEARPLVHAEGLGTLASEDLAALLAGRPIFVSAATYEPFGLAVLEAAQAGCALVLADRPGFRELWDEAALFVDPADPSAIAAAVDRLIAAPSARKALGAAARRRSAEFTPGAMASAMLGLHGTLAAALQKAAA
jgi:glycosyltransferase involved in cell wall biosynthesis